MVADTSPDVGFFSRTHILCAPVDSAEVRKLAPSISVHDPASSWYSYAHPVRVFVSVTLTVASSLITAWIEDALIGCGDLLISFDICVVSVICLISTFQREDGRGRSIASYIVRLRTSHAPGVPLLDGRIYAELLLPPH